MKLYPWLKKPYKNIIQQHQKKKSHHAFLIKTQRGIGVSRLIWFVSRWLLCLKPIEMNFCNICHSCKLMIAKNHPDWYHLKSEKDSTFNIDYIRAINEKIFQCPQQGQSKVIFLSDTAKLKESAMNAFLKTLEEPPKNTWFFLINYKYFNYQKTLHSRCIIYKLFPPLEKDSLNWLQQKQTKKNETLYISILRIHQGSPISAKKFLDQGLWIDRINFIESLFNAVKTKNLLKILPMLNKKNNIEKINWIYFLLFDAIELNLNKNSNNLTNIDQIQIIQFFSQNYTYSILDASQRSWIKCRYKLLYISGINHELLLLEQLLKWEKILNII